MRRSPCRSPCAADPLGIIGRHVHKEFSGRVLKGVVHSFQKVTKSYTLRSGLRHYRVGPGHYGIIYEDCDWEQLEPGKVSAILT